MAYTRVNWEDLPSTNTPITASNLNNMDAGIKENDIKLNIGTEIDDEYRVNITHSRNLFDISKCLYISGQATSLTLSNGVLTATGSTNAHSEYRFNVQVGKTYTISWKNATSFNSVQALTSSSGTQYARNYNATGSITFTAKSSELYLKILSSGTTLTIADFTINEGSTALTPYEPYVEPSINVDGEELFPKYDGTIYANDFKCRNLFNGSTITNLWVQSGTGNIITENNSNVQKIDCKAGETYTIKATFSSSSVDNIVLIAFYDNNGSLLQRIAEGSTYIITATAPANTAYMYAGHYIKKPTTIQLEIGSEATSYTPYKNFENEEVYSTNEIRIGRWINGKPLYRKVISNWVVPSHNSSISITIGYLPNVSNIVNLYGCYIDEGGATRIVGQISPNGGEISRLLHLSNNGAILFEMSAFGANVSLTTTLEYTKTTD